MEREDEDPAETTTIVMCPYCGESVDIALDPSGGTSQTYVEDCEVCCNPIQVRYSVEDDAISGFEANVLE